nr:LicD family protein [Thomasclavelia spiroformis]
MKRISSQEIQSLELNILKSFKTFAQENNIIYYLCGGTLLGAIRHKGFIPWTMILIFVFQEIHTIN